MGGGTVIRSKFALALAAALPALCVAGPGFAQDTGGAAQAPGTEGAQAPGTGGAQAPTSGAAQAGGEPPRWQFVPIVSVTETFTDNVAGVGGGRAGVPGGTTRFATIGSGADLIN